MANSCNRCGRQIVTAWITAKGNFYHPHCFTCAICDVVIESEEHEYVESSDLKEIYCRKCYTEFFGPLEENEEESSPQVNAKLPQDDDFASSTCPEQQMSTLTHYNSQPPKFCTKEAKFQCPAEYLCISQEYFAKHGSVSDDFSSLTNDNQRNNGDRLIEPFDFKLSAVIESTKPPAFMKEKLSNSSSQASKIPKWKSHVRLSQRPESDASCPNIQNSGFNCFLPKPPQNLIRAKSFHVPQQIRSKINDYINSKGSKFNMKRSKTPVPPNPDEELKSRTPRKPIYNQNHVNEDKIMSNARLTKSVNSTTNFKANPNSLSSMFIPNRNKSFTVKPETKQSTFKMPSFTVPKFATGVSWNANFQQPSKPASPSTPRLKKSRVSTPPRIQAQQTTFNHYLLPQEIMKGKRISPTAEKCNNMDGKPQCGGNALRNYPPFPSVSSYFGNSTTSTTSSPNSKKRTISAKQQQRKVSKKVSEVDNQDSDVSAGGGTHGALDCPICLDKLVNLHSHKPQESKENVVTCCGHIFHKTCIHNWLSANGNSRCPTCSKMCLKESLIPVYIEANIADNVNIRNADTEELKQLLFTLRSDYKQLREKYQALLKEHNESRFAINDSLRSAYEMESRTRGQLQWENKILHQKLDEMRSMIGIEQGDNFHNESTTSSPDMFTFTQNFDRNHNQPNSDTENE